MSRGGWYRNSLEDNPAWRYQIPADASPPISIGPDSSKGSRPRISTSSVFINGAFIGIIQAAFPLIYGSTKPILPISSAAKPSPPPAWRREAFAARSITRTATWPTPSARFTNKR
jgi:hypothetical protein